MCLGSCTGRVVGRVVNVCRCNKGGQGEQAVVGVASKRAGVGKCNNNTPATTPTAVITITPPLVHQISRCVTLARGYVYGTGQQEEKGG